MSSDPPATPETTPDPAPSEQLLRGHPMVRECMVLALPRGDGTRRLVAYVVPQPDYAAALAQPLAPTAEAAQIAQWQARYAAMYPAPSAPPDPAFNTAGWSDQGTGQPLPAAAMREWVDQTVARLRAGRPRRVLEIGCGTGLLLWRLAPTCREYWATDFAPEALHGLRQALDNARPPLPQVTLLECAADDLRGLPAAHFDLVILNSVIQYFPSLTYLQRVLAGIGPLLAPGGCIFLGDVRSLRLLSLFHTWAVLAQAADGCPCQELQERVAARVAGEQELLLDPALFAALPQAFPAIQGVDVQLKRGQWPTEMALFRYDVMLHTGMAGAPVPEDAWQEWAALGGTVAAVQERLVADQPRVLGVTDVPNGRLLSVLAAQALLADPDGPATAGALRRRLAAAPGPADVAPETFWILEATLPYDITVRPAASGRVACYDVLCRRRIQQARSESPGASLVVLGEMGEWPPAWQAYANTPRRGDEPGMLVRELRGWLAARLPPDDQPRAFVVLEAFPRTSTGQIDRAALPGRDPAPAHPESANPAG